MGQADGQDAGGFVGRTYGSAVRGHWRSHAGGLERTGLPDQYLGFLGRPGYLVCGALT